jgi:Ca2+-binding EF-hand superfamily protein
MFRATCLIGALALFPAAASAQQPCTSDARRVVSEVYQRILERQFDSRGENLVTQLQAGQTTVRDIVRAVARLPEHQQRFLTGDRQAAVTHLYKHLLGREPDPVGLRDHVNGAAADGLGAVIDAMIASGEYAQNFGDYGVPGSSVRFCGPGEASSNNNNNNNNRRNNRANRFVEMDANNNGIIERTEWRGTREAFVVEDWNGDNVLSGDEVRPGARRANRRGNNAGNAPGSFSSWDATTFTTLDRNGDGRLSASEWRYDTASFVQADRNGDGSLARTEFLSGANTANSDRFAALDLNGDGRLSPAEFDGTRRGFNQQDANRDGVLTRREFDSGGALPTTGR